MIKLEVNIWRLVGFRAFKLSFASLKKKIYLARRGLYCYTIFR